LLVNGINSPILRSAIASPIAAATGHIVGGTANGMIFEGNSFWTAAENSLDGIGKSVAFGTALGVTTTIAVSYANGINPFNGNRNQLVYRAGEKAEEVIGGKCAVAGTAKHEYATELIKRYQSIYGDRGLETKFRFNNGIGNRGILDVYSPKNNIIYDWKFGYSNTTILQLLNTPQMIKYYNNFNSPTITIFKY
jgi:hypothetical protein